MIETEAARLKRWILGAPVGTIRYWLTLVAVVARLGTTRRSRIAMRCIGVLSPIKDRLGIDRPVSVAITYGGLDLRWKVGPRSDFEVLNEVLVLGVYDDLPPDARVILDLGSHIGASILFFRSRFPSALIVGLEADPNTFQRLQANVAALPNVRIIQAAVTTSDGPIPFFPAKQSWVSSTNARDDRVGVIVDGQSFDGLIRRFGRVDLVKLDIEGAERELIAGTNQLANVGAIVGEYHDSSDPRDRTAFFDRLSGFDLRVCGEVGSVTHFAALQRVRLA